MKYMVQILFLYSKQRFSLKICTLMLAAKKRRTWCDLTNYEKRLIAREVVQNLSRNIRKPRRSAAETSGR